MAAEIASLAQDDETLRELCKSHDEMYPKRKKASIGDFVKLKKVSTAPGPGWILTCKRKREFKLPWRKAGLLNHLDD